jgi:hypothetical protein
MFFLQDINAEQGCSNNFVSFLFHAKFVVIYTTIFYFQLLFHLLGYNLRAINLPCCLILAHC